MGTLMQLITEALRVIFEIIPRVQKICADEKGIKFLFWDNLKVLNPWIYIYIPLFHKIEILTISRRSINLKKQSLITKDNKKVMLESACFYKIVDIKTAIVDNHDIRDIIEDIVLSNIKTYILENDLNYIINNIKQIELDIVEKWEDHEKETGIKILMVRITDIAPCIHFNNIKNVTYSKVKMN